MLVAGHIPLLRNRCSHTWWDTWRIVLSSTRLQEQFHINILLAFS